MRVPARVATAVAFCVVIQLLLQHSNADYRTGPLKYLFANAEVHRFDHHKGAAAGDVDFGLFTTFWDHLMGTFLYRPGAAPIRSDQLGIAGDDDYPQDYLAQLLQPFRWGRTGSRERRVDPEPQLGGILSNFGKAGSRTSQA